MELGGGITLLGGMLCLLGLAGLFRPRLVFGAKSRAVVGLALIGGFALFLIGGSLSGTAHDAATISLSAKPQRQP